MNRRLAAMLIAVAVTSCGLGLFILSQRNKPLPLFMRLRVNEGGRSRQLNFLCDSHGNLMLVDFDRNTLFLVGPGEALGFGFRPLPSGAHIERNGKSWTVPAAENTLLIGEDGGRFKAHRLPPRFTSRIITTRPYDSLRTFPPDDLFLFLMNCCRPDDAEILSVLSPLRSNSTQPSFSPASSPSQQVEKD